MKKNVLVTGATGLVGCALKSLQCDGDYNFVYINSEICDLKDYNKVCNYFNIIKPEIVIHLAACVGGLFKNMNEKVKMFEDNILINTHVIKAAYECGTQELIACLSTCVFPDERDCLDETMLHDGPPHHSNEGYAYAKRMMDIHCKLYRENFGKRYFCIIPTNIYGPNDNFNLEDAHVIPALIHKCYIAKQQSIPFEVRGTGRPLRQFIYSIDLAKIILQLLESSINENVIISGSDEYSIEQVSIIINKSFGNKLVFNNRYADGQYRKTSDNRKLIKHINFQFTDLNTGIEQTVEWFISNYNTLRK
jgi:GDP-L-fucose synthase